MKKILGILGVISLTGAVGISVIACNDPKPNDNGGNGNNEESIPWTDLEPSNPNIENAIEISIFIKNKDIEVGEDSFEDQMNTKPKEIFDVLIAHNENLKEIDELSKLIELSKKDTNSRVQNKETWIIRVIEDNEYIKGTTEINFIIGEIVDLSLYNGEILTFSEELNDKLILDTFYNKYINEWKNVVKKEELWIKKKQKTISGSNQYIIFAKYDAKTIKGKMELIAHYKFEEELIKFEKIKSDIQYSINRLQKPDNLKVLEEQIKR